MLKSQVQNENEYKISQMRLIFLFYTAEMILLSWHVEVE